jgi:ribonuclease BN (tRNA processing enzyme)
MKITILGSGTCVPSLKRNAPGYLLEIDDKKILVDCGSGTLLQLEKIKKGLYKEIDYVFITHCHIDHVNDLRTLTQALNWTPGYDRKKPLTIIGSPKFLEFDSVMINRIVKSPRENTYEIIVKEIKEDFILDDLTVKSAKTLHSEDSIAYRFESGGKSFVFSGDSDYCQELINLAKEVNLLIIECSFCDNEKMEGHLTSSECGEIAKKAEVKKLILSHLYPTSTVTKRLEECKKIFENVTLAEDLMEVII